MALFIRPAIELTVAPVRNPPFVTLSDGTIRNTYDVRLRNKHHEARPFALSLTSETTLTLSIEGEQTRIVEVPADSQQLVRLYLAARPEDAAADAGRTPVRIWVEDRVSGERASVDTTFVGQETTP